MNDPGGSNFPRSVIYKPRLVASAPVPVRLPSAPAVSSAVHWFLRVLGVLCGSCCLPKDSATRPLRAINILPVLHVKLVSSRIREMVRSS